LEGANNVLEKVRWRHRDSGDEHCYPIQHLFSFIGADPNTDWLTNSGVRLDDKGFILTGEEGGHPLATSREGVFAVGDIRSTSIKRVAASVGEGSTVVSALHAFLAKQRAALAQAAQ
jgi:thioredoxin reductase (NADPH)